MNSPCHFVCVRAPTPFPVHYLCINSFFPPIWSGKNGDTWFVLLFYIDLRLYNYFVIFDRQIIFSSTEHVHFFPWMKCVRDVTAAAVVVVLFTFLSSLQSFDRFIWRLPYCWHNRSAHICNVEGRQYFGRFFST